jgi:molecular chaperone GrpE
MVKKDKKTKEIVELEQKIGELTAGWQRTQADFLNYKKQAAEDKVKYCRSANANLVHDLLPVLDNFQLAAKHVPENLVNDNWAQGIKQIEKQFEDILSTEGLERIETVGTKFDPMVHEAIEHIESDRPEDEIVEEILAGYKFDSEVIRPARVKVSKGK